MSKEIQSMTDPNTAVLLRADGVYHSIEIDEDCNQLSVRAFDTATMDDDTESQNYADFDERSELLLRAFATITERVRLNKTRIVHTLDNSKPADIYDPLASGTSVITDEEMETFRCLKCGHDVSAEAKAGEESADPSSEFICPKCGFIDYV